ncbi:MAG: WbqC family protein [Candidatus Thermoplasmatota archaeon]|nr:WbqC family protein [Candidatus Thermoplasmatota archaeon]
MSNKSKVVTIHQPQYIPYLGFFNKVYNSDIFIVLDDVFNFKGDFTNRNRIKTVGGLQWLTIPLSRDKRIIKDVIIKDEIWINKHLKSIKYNYSKSAFFDSFMPGFEKILRSKAWTKLIDLNMSLLQHLFKVLKLEVEIVFSSNISKNSSGSDRLIELIKHVNCERYLAGPGSYNYLDVSLFEASEIEVINQTFVQKKYKQLHGKFESNLSILDSLFNLGSDGVRELIR